jgi:hypothetical protein
MARKAKTRLTFQVSLDIPTGVNIPTVRQFIRDALTHYHKGSASMAEADLSTVKIHLTNKETSYA